jgi:peptide/nickel transport system permease protein
MASAAPPISAPPLSRPRHALIEFCRQQPLGAASLVVICAMMFAGVFSELVAPYDPLQIDFASILGPPSWSHWCGTDAYGRDICSRLIYGSRTALVIGFTASFVGSSIGAILGIASAYFGGRTTASSSVSSMSCSPSRSSSWRSSSSPRFESQSSAAST